MAVAFREKAPTFSLPSEILPVPLTESVLFDLAGSPDPKNNWLEPMLKFPPLTERELVWPPSHTLPFVLTVGTPVDGDASIGRERSRDGERAGADAGRAVPGVRAAREGERAVSGLGETIGPTEDITRDSEILSPDRAAIIHRPSLAPPEGDV